MDQNQEGADSLTIQKRHQTEISQMGKSLLLDNNCRDDYDATGNIVFNLNGCRLQQHSPWTNMSEINQIKERCLQQQKKANDSSSGFFLI